MQILIDFKRLVMQKKCSYFIQNYTGCHFETIYNFVILSVHNKNTNILYLSYLYASQ